MSFEKSPSVFFVNAYSDPIYLKIKGRVSYLNCGPINDFYSQIILQSTVNLIIDFAECTGVDSTFLGILAGLALEFKKKDNKRMIFLCNLSNRNLELIRNLGLDRIIQINLGKHVIDAGSHSVTQLQPLDIQNKTKPETILAAHQNLIDAQPSNLHKFQDLISFIKKSPIKNN